MQEKPEPATRIEQIVHHATVLVDVILKRRSAKNRAEKDAAATAQREQESALIKAVKNPER